MDFETISFTLIGLLLFLWIFLQSLSWVSFQGSSPIVCWAPGTLPGFLEQLLSHPSTFVKVFSRHTLFNSVHVVTLPLTKIRLKKPRVLIRSFFWQNVILSDPPVWNFIFQIQGKKDPSSRRMLDKAAKGWMSYRSSHPELSHEDMIQQVVFYLRAIGFFSSSRLLLETLDFQNPTFIETLIQVGEMLPWQQFVIYVTLPAPFDSHLLISLSFRGLLRHAKQEATVSIDKMKLLAKRKILDSGFRTADAIMKKMIDSIEETETDVEFVFRARTVSSEEEWVEMLSELEVQRFKNKENVAATLTRRLEDLAFTSVQVSLVDPTLLLSSTFRKTLKWKPGSMPTFDNFHLTITASKLGLPSGVLKANTDFYLFAKKNALHRYLLVFNHQLRYDPSTLEVLILYKGQYEKFNSISKVIPRSPVDPLEMTGHYSQHGLVDEGLYDWKTLSPFLKALPPNATVDPDNESTGLPVKLNHDWGDRYVLEVCSWIIDEPRLGGDHTWFRLKTPDGYVYSVGQYRPKKFGFHEQFVFPMKIKVSQFSSPDLCEFWTGTYRTLSMEISGNQFRAMKRQIEIDQSKKEHIYQIYKDNCVQYFISIAQLAGIHFPTKIHLYDLLITNPTLKRMRQSFNSSHLIPEFVKKGAHFSWVLLINAANLFLGAGMIDKELKNDPKSSDIRPYIQKWTDLVDAEKVVAHHPFVIGDFIARDVEDWRISKTCELEAYLSRNTLHEIDIKKEIESVRFSLPPWYRLPTVDRVFNDE